jgi:hypothetical protein
MPTSSITRPSKIYPNWNFWFENKPSGKKPSDQKTILQNVKSLGVPFIKLIYKAKV